MSVSVGSDDSTLSLSQLTPGSSYEVSVVSILRLDESDPVSDSVGTRTYRRVLGLNASTWQNAGVLIAPPTGKTEKDTSMYLPGDSQDEPKLLVPAPADAHRSLCSRSGLRLTETVINPVF